MRSFLIAAALAALATPTFASTVVLQDTFDGDSLTTAPTDFSTGYSYITPSTMNTSAGQFSIATNGGGWNRFFVNLPDHTGGGQYMIVNGAPLDGDGDLAPVWSKAVTTLAAGDYTLSFDIADLCCVMKYDNGGGAGIDTSQATLAAKIGGVSLTLNNVALGRPNNGDGVWQEVTATFHVDAAQSGVTFALFDTNTVGEGNDFGLDDILLTRADGPPVTTQTGPASSTPEPASWALMLLGFAGLGAALRNRRRALAAAV